MCYCRWRQSPGAACGAPCQAHREERAGMDWIIYVLVGLAVGLSMGYTIGIRRGTLIVAGLLEGIMSAGGTKGADTGGTKS